MLLKVFQNLFYVCEHAYFRYVDCKIRCDGAEQETATLRTSLSKLQQEMQELQQLQQREHSPSGGVEERTFREEGVESEEEETEYNGAGEEGVESDATEEEGAEFDGTGEEGAEFDGEEGAGSDGGVAGLEADVERLTEEKLLGDVEIESLQKQLSVSETYRGLLHTTTLCVPMLYLVIRVIPTWRVLWYLANVLH